MGVVLGCVMHTHSSCYGHVQCFSNNSCGPRILYRFEDLSFFYFGLTF